MMKFVIVVLLLLTLSFSAAAQSPATLTSPADNATLTNPAVTFGWNKPAGAITRFTLRVEHQATGFRYVKQLTPSQAGCASSSTCTFSPTDLALRTGLTYRWAVVVRTGGGNARSAWRGFTTNFPKPGVPSLNNPATGHVQENGAVMFSWGTSSNATRYQLRVLNKAGTQVFAQTVQATSCGSACSLNVTTLSPGQYTWFVRAIGAGGAANSATRTLRLLNRNQMMLRLVNQARCEAGVPPLALNPQLNQASRLHSVDMATNDYFSHIGQDGRTPGQRASAAGYTGSYIHENIAAGSGTVAATFNQWWESTEHRNNILNSGLREMGIGFAYSASSEYKNYWTQMFGRRSTAVLGVCP